MATYSESVVYQFWNDSTGERVTASEDGDAVGLVEIKNIDSVGKPLQILTLTPEQATWLCKVLPMLVENLNKNVK